MTDLRELVREMRKRDPRDLPGDKPSGMRPLRAVLAWADRLEAALDAVPEAPDLPDVAPASPLPWMHGASADAHGGWCAYLDDANGEPVDFDDEANSAYAEVACNAYPSMRAELLRLRERNEELEAFAQYLVRSYDCDEGAHRYGHASTQCRYCMAEALLATNDKSPDPRPGVSSQKADS